MRHKERIIRINNNNRASELLNKSTKEALTIEEIEELKVLHTGYGGIGDNTQYFTPKEVISYMIESLKAVGFKGGKVLEPSCGNGMFIGSLLDSFDNLDITGVELSNELAMLNRVCYPNVNIMQGNTLSYLEELEGKFDLVIGNPPFGKGTKNYDLPLGIGKLEGQFVQLSAKALKPNGHLIMVVPTSVLSIEGYRKLRAWLLDEFVLIQSIQLPNNTFYKSGANVGTGVIQLRKKSKLIGDMENDYSVFMAMIESIGWDKSGREKENKLIGCLENFKEFYKNNGKDFNIYI